MKSTRKIIEIDEAKCNGCGKCILSCAEGALRLIDGKARLVEDFYCDGLGACIGECPEGALKIIERDAHDFDEQAVHKHLHAESDNASSALKPTVMACGCPSTAMQTLKPQTSISEPYQTRQESPSMLGHWPVKLQLLGPQAPFLQAADLVLLADCVAVACPDLHRRFLNGKAVAIGCPKLDNLDAHIERLAAILKGAKPKSLTVAHMEVPCCSAFAQAAQEAIRRAGVDIPLSRIVIKRDGTVLGDERFSIV
ncbi:MAG: 4Fe-4S ferredoxin [Deltaproteobacteria bacterium]|nr:4Fe-4S ferredoxin [Deltaproteobacteria bacterium]